MASTDDFPLTPDYPISETLEDGVLRSRSLGRKEYARAIAPSLRTFRLVLSGRPTSEMISLSSFYREIQSDYFTLTYPNYAVLAGVWHDRIFPVRFAGPPQIDYIGNDEYNMQCEPVEAAGCALEAGDYPLPSDGQPTATIVGTVTGSDKYFIYSGYGFTYTGAGTLTLDGVSATSPKFDVPLGLHRLYVTGGSGTLEVVV